MKISRSARLCFIVAILALSLTLPAALAGFGDDFEQVMIPIYFLEPFSSGAGVFETRLTILNSGPEQAYMIYQFECPINECLGELRAQPGVTFSPDLFRDGVGINSYIQKPLADSVVFDLRVREVSNTDSWGARIPVVRERDLKTGKLQLIGIPLSGSFRQTLRIYDFDSRDRSRVVVRIFGTRPDLKDPREGQPDTLLFEEEFKFQPASAENPDSASYIQLGDFRQLIGPTDAVYETVRVEIEPRTEGLRFWAFVSINNSVSQSISMIWP